MLKVIWIVILIFTERSIWMSKVIRLSDELLSKLDLVKNNEAARIDTDEDKAIFESVFRDENEIISFVVNCYLISRRII